MSLRMTKAEREAFLSDLHVGIIGIDQPGRSPLAVPIWYDYEPGTGLWIITGRDSLKGRLLDAAGRFSLSQTEDPPYRRPPRRPQRHLHPPARALEDRRLLQALQQQLTVGISLLSRRRSRPGNPPWIDPPVSRPSAAEEPRTRCRNRTGSLPSLPPLSTLPRPLPAVEPAGRGRRIQPRPAGRSASRMLLRVEQYVRDAASDLPRCAQHAVVIPLLQNGPLRSNTRLTARARRAPNDFMPRPRA